MRKKTSLMMFVAILMVAFLAVSPAAAQFADGTYSVPYEMKEANSDNTSIADGYFVSPASVTIQNGVATVTVTVTGAEYVKSLPGSTTVSEDAEKKTVRYTVNDLTQPFSVDMTINVPDLYDQTHTARMAFDTSGLPAQGTSTPASESADETAGAQGELVDNPKTGEDSSIALYASLMLASVIALVAVWKFRPARN